MSSAKKKLVHMAGDLRTYWKRPPEGRYMPFKELISLAVGGFGVKCICFAVQPMLLSVGNTLIGNTIGIPPREIYLIYILSVLASFPLTGIRARMVDNSRNKKGRFRPYIFTMASPTVILAMGFTWMPYDRMSMVWKCVTVLLFNIGFQFFYMFMFDSYTNIINVLSPNTYERSDAFSVTGVVDSLAPTVLNFILPLLAKVITGQNTIYDMSIYRAVYPPILLLGLLFTIFIYTNTEEKIVQAKTHVIQVKFMDALRAVAKNKYFWIISLAGWIGFLESSFATILAWLYNYQNACTPMEYSVITAIYGNSALWSMLLSPYLVRKVGKRKLMIYTNVMSIFFILMMYPVVMDVSGRALIWLLMGCMFINGVGTSMGNLLTYSLNSDIRDYQQYITGERIDGMFFAVGLIGSVVGMATGTVLPAIYDWAGLNAETAVALGYDASNVYHVLYNEAYFERICGILIIASAIGATLNAIPYFFYDLTELKQKAMVTVLKIRALFEDYGNGALSDEKLVEAIDLIDEAEAYVGKEPVKPTKDGIRAARKSRDRAAVRAAKKAYAAQREYNEKIAIAQYVVREVHKFERPEVQAQVARARQICAAGLQGLSALHTISLREAKAMPKSTPAEKELRRQAIDTARQERFSKKMTAKYYPNGIELFDRSVFDEIFAREDAIELERHEKINQLAQTRKNKDSAAVKRLQEELHQLQIEKQQLARREKTLGDQYARFTRAAKPWLDAKKLLAQQENYAHYEEIRARYEESKARAEEERAARLAEEARLKAEREARSVRSRRERREAKK